MELINDALEIVSPSAQNKNTIVPNIGNSEATAYLGRMTTS